MAAYPVAVLMYPGQWSLKKVNADLNEVVFTKETPSGEEIKLPLLDNDMFNGIQPGQCGLVKVQAQTVCTGFKPAQDGSGGVPSTQQSGSKGYLKGLPRKGKGRSGALGGGRGGLAVESALEWSHATG